MSALPGFTTTSLTKERTKALVSVSSLVFRYSLISVGRQPIAYYGSTTCTLPANSSLT